MLMQFTLWGNLSKSGHPTFVPLFESKMTDKVYTYYTNILKQFILGESLSDSGPPTFVPLFKCRYDKHNEFEF